MPLLNFIAALVIIAALIGGFKLAGRWAKTVPMQVLVGSLLGIGIMVGVVCVLFGVLFAGCIIMGSPSFH